MDKEEKEKRVKLIADTIEYLMKQIDLFVNQMTYEDIEILIESKEALKEKISRNESAMALIFALGGNYDSSEDEMKIETLDCLIKIIKARNKYKEKLLEQREQIKKRQEALRMLGL